MGCWGLWDRAASDSIDSCLHTTAGTLSQLNQSAGQQPEEKNSMGGTNSIYQQQWFSALPWGQTVSGPRTGTVTPGLVAELAPSRNSINLPLSK